MACCLRNRYYRRHKLSGAAKSTPYKVPQYGEAGTPYGQAIVFPDAKKQDIHIQMDIYYLRIEIMYKHLEDKVHLVV